MIKLTSLIVLLVVLTASTYGDQNTVGQRLLSTGGFKLISRITTDYSHAPKKRQVVQEFYSNAQKRARIQVDRDEFGENHSIYFYDASRKGLFVQHNLDPLAHAKCVQIDDSAYLDALQGFKVASDSSGKESLNRGQDWLKEIGQTAGAAVSSDHVVGLARIALWIESHKQDFEPAGDKEYQGIEVHNVAVKIHHLRKNFDSFPLSTTEVNVYYPATPSQQDWFGFPLAVEVRRRDGDWIYLEFMNFAIMRDDLELGNSRYPLDMFALPVGLDCTKGMKPLNGWTFSRDDVSFRAELLDYAARGKDAQPVSVSEQFFAWDSVSQLLRMDSYTFYRYTVSIIDFASTYRYNIYHNTHSTNLEKDARGNLKNDNMFDRYFNSLECVKTPLYLSRSAKELFFPFKDMIPIGRAKIRGVDCRAFEMSTDQLPATLFPPITYSESEHLSKTGYMIGEDLKGANYNLVYYFAANPASTKRRIAEVGDESLGALMRVDVYLRGELLYHMDVTEFAQGKLADAPNGDRAKELFSLRDRCNSGRLGELNHANLRAELTLKLVDSAKASAKDISASLSSSSVRTQAVVRTLAKPARYLMTDLYDVETQMKLTDHDNELKIYLEARMTRPDLLNVWPKLVGYAITRESSFSASSADCLVYAALLQQSSSAVTVMVNCPHQCYAVADSSIEFSKDGKEIISDPRGIFISFATTKISEDHCPLLLLDREKEVLNDELDFLTHSRWIHDQLRGNALVLELPGIDTENMAKFGTTILKVAVDHIDISNDHWSASTRQISATANLSAQDKESIDGVGLTQASGQNLGVSFKLGTEEVAMDYNHCHSLCAAKPTCNSFSICLAPRGQECFISEVDFRSADLLGQIEQKRAELKSSTDRQVMKVPTKGTPSEVELLFDLRCKIYKRNTLEMFHKIESGYMELQRMYAVDSLEECASMCWSNNVNYLNKMDEVVEQLGEDVDSNAVAEKMKTEVEKLKVKWCSRFRYLDLSHSSDLDWVKTLVQGNSLDQVSLCSPDKPLADKSSELQWIEAKDLPNRTKKPLFEKFEFMYKSLFAGEYGKRIIESSKEKRERRQILLNWADEEFCAKTCFMQTEQLEPRCKSFDIIESKHYSNGHMVRYCVLHSHTFEDLKQAGLSALIEETTERTSGRASTGDEMFVRSWHFEPKLHAMASFAITRRATSLIENGASPVSAVGSMIWYRNYGTCLVLLASIVCTVLIVRSKGSAVVGYFSAPRRGSVASLAGSINNFEG